jgi:hypothetical protein
MFRLSPYQGIARGLQSLFALVITLCYLAANVQFDSLHGLIHHEEAIISHDEADENDPCHRKLYHDDFSKGCEHKSHFLSLKKCSLCDHHLTVDKILQSDELPIAIDHTFSCARTVITTAPLTFSFQLPARGPPTA